MKRPVLIVVLFLVLIFTQHAWAGKLFSGYLRSFSECNFNSDLVNGTNLAATNNPSSPELVSTGTTDFTRKKAEKLVPAVVTTKLNTSGKKHEANHSKSVVTKGWTGSAEGIMKPGGLRENLSSHLGFKKYYSDKISPTVTLSTTVESLVNGPFKIRITFSENITNFSLTDLTLENATASKFTSVSNSVYTALVIPIAEGMVTMQIKANVANDAAGNNNLASNILKIRYDNSLPGGYSVAFKQDQINAANVSQASLKITHAEKQAAYFYTINSAGSEALVTGSGTAQESDFEINSLNLTSLRDGQLTVSFYQQDIAGNKGPVVTAQVTKNTRNIDKVAQPAALSVPVRTTFAQLPLPPQVEVTYFTNETEKLNVIWQPGAYNEQQSGQYEIAGTLNLAPGTTNLSNHLARITVEVQANHAPTALRLSNNTFKPAIAKTEAIGIFETVDPDDTHFTYTLVAGPDDTHNNLFHIKENNLFLASDTGLSGQTQFNIRVKTLDSFHNSLEQTFTLVKTAYNKPADQLKIITAFSPNGDGVNDEWIIPELKYYNQVSVEIFNRAGSRLFYTSNPEKGWNGQDQRGLTVQGVFMYIIQVTDIGLVKKGVVTVLGN